MVVLYKSTPDSWGGVYHHLARRLQVSGLPVSLIWDPGPVFNVGLDADVLIPTNIRISADVLRLLPKLRLIQQAGAGVDVVDILTATERGITVANVPTNVSGAANAVAEHAVGVILSLTRRHADFSDSIQRGVLGSPISTTLKGKTVGIIGFGSIGQALAGMLLPFGVSIIAVSRSGVTSGRLPNLRWIKGIDDLDQLLGAAHVVVIACPLDASTYHLIDRRRVKQCMRGATLINVSRGDLVDEESLLEALSSGHLAGVALDVLENEPVDPQNPLVGHPRVLISPHIAAATEDVAENVAAVVDANIHRLSQGLRIEHTIRVSGSRGSA